MIEHETLLVTLGSRMPVPLPPATRGRGRPRTNPARLFLQALVLMIARHLHPVHALFCVGAQPTAEMPSLRGLLTVEGRFPARRTWERRRPALPATRPAPIGGLGRAPGVLSHPWARCGRAAVLDRPVWRARGGVRLKQDREAGLVPPTAIDPAAHGTTSGRLGWVYGWTRPLVTTVAAVWSPLAAELTPANISANRPALPWLPA